MDSRYIETRPIMPRMLTYIMAGVFAATVVFMAFSDVFLGTAMPGWAIPVVAAVFALIIVGCLLLRFTVRVDGNFIEVTYALRKTTVPFDEVIDSRSGELALIRSYDRWNLKGVRHKAYMAIGEDYGVALKLTGKRVLVLSSADPDALFAAVPKEETE